MSKYPQTVQSCIVNLIDKLRKDPNYAQRTIRFYLEECTSIFNILIEHRSDILPYNVTIEDLDWLLFEMGRRNFTVSTKKGYVSALRKICRFYNNDVVAKKRIRWQQDMRPNVDWLKDEQAKALLNCSKTANQELIIHLELCMGLRRCEVGRLKPEHIHDGYIDVVGKGSMGGKLRRVPFHPRSEEVFLRYNQYRKDMLAVAQARHRTPPIMPDRYLVYERSGRIYNYSETKLSGIDQQLYDLQESLGFKFSNHTLRRTFGRVMYHSGAKTATIAKLLGHESEESTLRYIGVNLDDMTDAMNLFTLR